MNDANSSLYPCTQFEYGATVFWIDKSQIFHFIHLRQIFSFVDSNLRLKVLVRSTGNQCNRRNFSTSNDNDENFNFLCAILCICFATLEATGPTCNKTQGEPHVSWFTLKHKYSLILYYSLVFIIIFSSYY